MDVDKIIAGLSAADGACVVDRGGSHEAVTSPTIEPLWFAITKVENGHFRISLTETGLAVRARLLGEG